MKSRTEILHLLSQYKPTAVGKYGVTRIGIFGSAARGERHEGSDVDVVYEGEPNLLLRSRMKVELEALFGCRVDVGAIVNSLPAHSSGRRYNRT